MRRGGKDSEAGRPLTAGGGRVRWGRLGLALLLAVFVGGAATFAWIFHGWMEEGAQLARAHARFEQTHKGWSFPGRIVAPPPATGAPADRLITEAKARGYSAGCNGEPGTFCEAEGTVTPRDGERMEPLLLGWLIGEDAELRAHLPLGDAPEHLVQAIIASEDRRFHEHGGINLRAMVRALFANVKEGGFAQGGSTLSMQVVRTLTQKREKALWRKLREMGLAVGLDRALGKAGVLQMYLDAPYLGQRNGLGVCGFEAAAWHYFGKRAKELTAAESAALVALLPAPGTLGPKLGTEALRPRIHRVLAAMNEVHGENFETALADAVVPVQPLPLPERYPAYLSATRMFLEARLPSEVLHRRGLWVEVAIDVPLQEATEALFSERLAGLRTRGQPVDDGTGPGVGGSGADDEADDEGAAAPDALQAAGVALDPHTGALLALYGGEGLGAADFNRAVQARRQPGSSFKPLVYALAFSQRSADGKMRFNAATTEPNHLRVFDTPQGPWRPRNINWRYSRTASLAYALVWSQNVATASLLEELGGPSPLIAFAAELGFDTSAYPEEMGLSLGQAEVTVLEMAQFAGVLANGGRRLAGTPVLHAQDLSGTAHLGPPTAQERVLDEDAALLTRELMRLVIEEGTGRTTRGREGRPGYKGPAFGKTGTTDKERDLWFVGASPKVAMAVWLGFDQPRKVGGTAMELAAPLWGSWMARAVGEDGEALAGFSARSRVVRRSICRESGALVNSTCHPVTAPFLPGSTPKSRCDHEHPPPEPDEVELDPEAAEDEVKAR